jgi:hypothetical protein
MAVVEKKQGRKKKLSVVVTPIPEAEPGRLSVRFEFEFDQAKPKQRDAAMAKLVRMVKVVVPPKEREEFVTEFKAAAVLALAIHEPAGEAAPV